MAEVINALYLCVFPRVTLVLDVIKDPLEAISDTLQGEALIVWGVFEEAFTIKKGLESSDYSCGIGLDDSEGIAGVMASEGWQCRGDAVDQRDVDAERRLWWIRGGRRSGGRYRLQGWRWQKLGLRDWREQRFAARDQGGVLPGAVAKAIPFQIF